MVKASEVFGIDWTDLAQVQALAKKLGPGNVVIKYPDRPNYNITHASRLEGLNRGNFPVTDDK